MVVSTAIVISISPHSVARAAGASAPIFVAAPIRLNGYVRYSMTTGFPVTAPATTSEVFQSIGAQISARTRAYIWQPWFMQLAARLGVAANSSMGKRTRNSLALVGRGDLNFLPRSRYPFHAYIEQQTRSPEDTLFDVGYLSTRYGADQSISTRKAGTYRISYDAAIVNNRSSLVNQSSFGAFSDRTIADVFFRRPGNDLRLKGVFFRESQDDTETNHWGRILSATHRFQPTRNTDINSLASYDHSTDKNGPKYLDSKFSQVNSSFFWRPKGKPWVVSGSVNANQIKSKGGTSNTASASIGGSTWMEHSEHWRSSARMSAAKAKDSKGIFTQSVSSSYGDGTRFLGLGYNWRIGGSISNRMREGTNSQNYRISGGHGVNRSLPLLGGRASFNLNQSLFETYATLDRVIVTNLRHSASIGWAVSGQESSTDVRLSSNVSHVWGSLDRKGNTRLIDFRFTRKHQLSRYSALSGNIAVQASKSSTSLEGSNGYTGGARGILDYRHSRLFNVPHLRMSSTLVITSANVSRESGLPKDIDLEGWETRFDYYFGRVTTSLILRITGQEGEYSGIATFMLTRQFG